jgi:hypothetical protein
VMVTTLCGARGSAGYRNRHHTCALEADPGAEEAAAWYVGRMAKLVGRGAEISARSRARSQLPANLPARRGPDPGGRARELNPRQRAVLAAGATGEGAHSERSVTKEPVDLPKRIRAFDKMTLLFCSGQRLLQ